MEQFENFNRIMEAETISKNGTNLKSLISKKNFKLLVLVACLFMTFSGQAQKIRYVKLNGTGDGSSWGNASTDIQAMINASAVGDQVWIASETYLLTATLTMKEGVNVYGGFQGSESNINARSKGDLDKNGTVEAWEFTNSTILDGQNARRVLNQANPFEMETTWDGVTITKGNSTTGAGAYLRANGKLNNCTVKQNGIVLTDIYQSGIDGGGIYNNGGTISNCMIDGNTLSRNSPFSSRGGGICNFNGTINNCTVSGNKVFTSNNLSWGGGIFNNGGTVSNCMVYGNITSATASSIAYSSLSCGGGIYNYNGTVSNCTVNGNTAQASAQSASYSAVSRGGGIYNEGIVNTCCIYNNNVYYNEMSSGEGIYNNGTASNKAYVYNSTMLNNGKNNISNYNNSYVFAYNCIIENSDLEQNFIRPTSFVGQAGDDAQRAELLWVNWRLKQGSQYIEAGSLADLPNWVINGTDLAGNPRVSNGKISLGAYEYDPTASAIKLTHVDNGIKIYPNPVSDFFIVDYEGFIQVKIYDMLGKEILSQDTNGKTEININHLPKGIYNVSIISESRIIGNSKIVKQ